MTRHDGAKEPHKTWEGRLTEPLRPYFASKGLSQISADDIRQFQAQRNRMGIQSNTINHEVKGLLRLLKWAKLASRIRDDVKMLKAQREPRRMLVQAEKQRLFDTAASKPGWQTA